MARDRWLEDLGPEPREESLPKWAQRKLTGLRRRIARYAEGVVTKTGNESGRVFISLGSDGQGGSLVRYLPDNVTVVFSVTGGEVWVSLAAFGARYRVRATGMPSHARHIESTLAMLPALGNVVELGFVVDATEVMHVEPLAIAPQRAELEQ